MGRPLKNDDLMIDGLAHGKTQAEAARVAGVSERTIRRRLLHTEFAERVHQATAERVAANSARLTELSSRAIDVLDDLLDDEEPGIRLRAVQIMLKTGLDYRASTDTEARLLALEASRDIDPTATTGQ